MNLLYKSEYINANVLVGRIVWYNSIKFIPDYNGEDIIELNGNVPSFTDYERNNIKGDSYSDFSTPPYLYNRCHLIAWMMPQRAFYEITLTKQKKVL